jgi:hypothetical protein
MNGGLGRILATLVVLPEQPIPSNAHRRSGPVNSELVRFLA